MTWSRDPRLGPDSILDPGSKKREKTLKNVEKGVLKKKSALRGQSLTGKLAVIRYRAETVGIDAPRRDLSIPHSFSVWRVDAKKFWPSRDTSSKYTEKNEKTSTAKNDVRELVKKCDEKILAAAKPDGSC